MNTNKLYSKDNNSGKITLASQLEFVTAAHEEGFATNAAGDILRYYADGGVKKTDMKELINHIIYNISAGNDTYVIQTKISNESARIYNKFFTSYLPTVDFSGLYDTKNVINLVFQNYIVEIGKADVKLLNLSDKKHWVDSKMPRDYAKSDGRESEFSRFCRLITKNDENRFRTIKSVIGYIISTYKDPSYCPAVVMMDEGDNSLPAGRNGKGLFAKVLAQYRKRMLVDGKKLDRMDRFAYQEFEPSVQFIHLDDINRGFDIESFFSELTEGITYEQKGKQKIRIPYSASPKYIITTNDIVQGLGKSSYDRMFELEVHPYFSPEHRPYDEFGHNFIDDWDDAEWSRLDDFIIECAQFYIKHGLIRQYSYAMFELKKLRGNTTTDFPEWADENLDKPGMNLWAEDIKNKWTVFKPKSKVSDQTLFNWCREYFKYKKYVIIEDLKPARNPHTTKTMRRFVVWATNQAPVMENNIFSELDRKRIEA